MELVVVESPYRALVGPLLRYMDALQSLAPDPARSWWCWPRSCRATGGRTCSTTRPSLRLKLRLFGRRNTIVVDVPFHLD